MNAVILPLDAIHSVVFTVVRCPSVGSSVCDSGVGLSYCVETAELIHQTFYGPVILVFPQGNRNDRCYSHDGRVLMTRIPYSHDGRARYIRLFCYSHDRRVMMTRISILTTL